MGYDYDVFVSYKHGRMFGDWVHEHFVELLKECLGQSLGREAKIFLDRRDISGGDTWPERLKQALARSRCLVAVWSPLYFVSPWCCHECAVMLRREQHCGFRSRGNSGGLILPIVVHDGERFPDCVKNIHYENFSDYAREDLRQNTERYIRLQDDVVPLAGNAAEIINAAPRWSSEWLNNEWLDETVKAYNFELKPMPVTQPILE